MRYEDTSGSVGNSGTPEARDDADALATGSNGPATGNVISGAGTLTGKAGEDAASNAHVVAIRGAGGTDASNDGQSLHVDGRYGALVIDEHGNYKYVADGRAPADFRDLFQYTLADSKGGRSVADLVISRGAELKVADNAQRIVPGPDGVVTLPAGVDLNDVHVVGRNLVVTLPDGSQIVIVDGAVFVPQLVLGGVEVPSTNLAALLIDAEPKPAAGNPQSGGGNFDVPVPPLDPGVPLGDLIPPTELHFNDPIFEEIGQFVDREPEITIEPDGQPASVAALDSVNEAGLPARNEGEPAGSGEIADGNGSNNSDPSEATTGVFNIDSPDGIGSLVILDGNGDPVDVTAGGTVEGDFGVLTVTFSGGVYSYSYVLSDNTSGNTTHDDFSVTVTDDDGDQATATLTIDIIDDVPTARPDTDASVNGVATGNVMTDAAAGDVGDTDSNAADTVGADNASLTSVTGFNGSADSTFSGGLLNVNGQFGTLTIDAAGNYTYTVNPNAGGGGVDVFNYTLTDGDGDTTTSTLTITNPDLIPDVPENTVVGLDDDALAGGNPGTPAVNDDPDSVNTSGSVAAVSGDGTITYALSASGAPAGFSYSLQANGDLWVLQGGNHVLTVTLDQSGNYAVTQVNPIDHAAGNLENNADFTVTFSATDIDGDSDSGTLSISVDDDTPTIGRADVSTPTLHVDETVLATNASADFSTLFNVSYGADGPGTTVYGVNVVNGTDSGLIDVATGQSIFLFNNNGVVEGHVGNSMAGALSFTVSINSSTGVVTLDQVLALDHPDATNPDDAVSPGADTIQVTITATDADGDPVTDSVNIGDHLVFDDDGPSINVTANSDTGVLVQTQDHDTIGAATDTASSSANFGGIFGLTSSGGSDGASNTPALGYTLGVPGAGLNGVDSGLDQTGANIYLYSIGGVVVGSTSATQVGVNAGNTVFNVTVSATGVVTLNQFSQIDHPIAGDPSATGAPFADHILSMADGLVTLTATSSITDNDGDTAVDSATVGIGANLQFADDGPVATNDTDSIVGGNGPATGNVITGIDIVGGDSNTTDGNADAIGADTPGTITRIQSNNNANVDTTYDGSQNLVVVGQYGTLTINADGSYSYLRTSAAGGVNDVFTYTLTDRDGDTSTATLTIGIEDKFPAAGVVNVLLDDDALAGGNPGTPAVNDDIDSQNASGLLPGTGGDGPLAFSLSLAGNPAGFTYVDGPGESILVQQVQNGNPVTVLTVTITNTTTGAYTVVQNNPILHATQDGVVGSDNTENNQAFAITYNVTDADGDVAAPSGTININVDDDTPTVDVTKGADAGVVLLTQDADTIGAATDTAVSTANFSGVFGLTQSAGADGTNAAATLGFVLDVTGFAGGPGGVDSGLDQGGANIFLYEIGGKVVGSTSATLAGVGGANTVFDVGVSGTGVVTLTQYSQIDHPIAGDPSPTGTPYVDHIVSMVDSLVTLTASATLTDKDGDTVTDSEVVNIGANLQFADDGPTAVINLVAGQNVSLDESVGNQADSNDTAAPGVIAQFASVTNVGTDTDLPQYAQNASAIVTSTGSSVGADTPGTTGFSLNVSSAGVDSGLDTTDGQSIFLFKEGSVIVGRVGGAGGPAAFAIAIDNTGHISTVEYLSIQHNLNGLNPDDMVSITDGAVTASVTVTDSDGDTSTSTPVSIGSHIQFQDSGPVMTGASNINILNGSVDMAHTGTFAYALGADGALPSNDVLSVVGSATVNGAAVTNYTIVETSESATTAVYTFGFDYPNGTPAGAHETGTLTFDKVNGTYTVDLDSPLQGISIVQTATGTAFTGYDLGTSNETGSQPDVAVTQLRGDPANPLPTDLFIQFTSVAEPGSGTGANNLFTQNYSLDSTPANDGAPGTFTNGELFTQEAGWVSASGSANGVNGDTIGGGEVLDFNLYQGANPTGHLGTPTGTADTMFLKFDGITDSDANGEDLIVILKLYDTVTHTYTTKALIVQNSDIQNGPGTGPGQFSNITLDNNDGLIIIQPNDYQEGNANLVIVGAQLVDSDEGVVGTGINFNNAIGTGATGASTGTEAFSTDNNDGPLKVSSIGFVTTSTTAQVADLTFNVTVKDGDLDTISQTIHATITGNADSSTPIALSAAVTTVAPVVLDLNGDGTHFLSTDAGVHYDYGNGSVATAWAAADDGILVNDANHNGAVDNASEFVFGSGNVTDLQALAAADSNGDGQLSSADANFGNFAVWQDANSNGVADAGEVQSLAARGIASISLSSDGIAYSAAGGDVQVAGTGSYTNADGSTGSLADAAFVIESRAATNSVLMGALAAAGIAAEASASATTTASLAATTALTGVAGLHTQAFSPTALDAVSGDHVNASAILGSGNGAAHAADQAAASHASDAAQAHSLSGADNDAQSKQGPTELLAGTQAPAHDQAGASAAVAQIAAFAAPVAQHDIGQILADALHGGANGATIDHVLSSLPGNGGGAEAALAALASHGGEAVSNGDSHAFASFTTGHAAFNMEAMIVHVDAAPTHA